MILPAITLALLLQAQPASVSGVVTQSGTGEPIANVRVSLARTDAALGAFAQMIAGDRPPGDVSIPGEFLAVMAEQLSAQVGNPNVSAGDLAEARAMASLPVADIAELMISASGDVGVIYKSTPPMMSDSQGRFDFSNVAPGTYKLVFTGNGFARQEYGQRGVGSAGIPIVLGAGQTKNDIVMRMSRVGAIGGRVADSAGRPAAGVPVQLFRFAYDETGQRKVQRAASAQTDDRGQYRIYYLSPGRYFLSAGNPPGQSADAIISREQLTILGIPGNFIPQNRYPEMFEVSYYPGVPDANSATAIDVQSGAEIRGVDMYLKPQRTYRVRGVVVDPRTGQPPVSVNMSFELQAPDSQGNSFVNFGFGGQNYNRTDGTFEYQGISSGTYIVTASLPASPPPPRPPNMTPEEQRALSEVLAANAAAAPKAIAAINVTNSDVEGIQLRVGISGSFAGRIRFEPPAAEPAPDFAFIRIQLRSVDGSAPGNQPQPRQPKDDGTFRIDGIWPGEYRLLAIGLPPGFYLKEARLGEANLLNGHIRFNGSETGTLEVLISSDTGQVSGIASDSQGRPVPGARVVLVPEGNRVRTELFRPVSADPEGRFRIPNVAPGDYKLVAWETIEPFAFFDPELLKQADENGKLIHVGESSSQTMNVSALPSQF